MAKSQSLISTDGMKPDAMDKQDIVVLHGLTLATDAQLLAEMTTRLHNGSREMPRNRLMGISLELRTRIHKLATTTACVDLHDVGEFTNVYHPLNYVSRLVRTEFRLVWKAASPTLVMVMSTFFEKNHLSRFHFRGVREDSFDFLEADVYDEDFSMLTDIVEHTLGDEHNRYRDLTTEVRLHPTTSSTSSTKMQSRGCKLIRRSIRKLLFQVQRS